MTLNLHFQTKHKYQVKKTAQISNEQGQYAGSAGKIKLYHLSNKIYIKQKMWPS